jgi:hypothetical protein
VTRGGYRPGAGRPGAGRETRVMVNLTPDETEALDASRGTLSRSEAIREGWLRGLGAQEETAMATYTVRRATITGGPYGDPIDDEDQRADLREEIAEAMATGEAGGEVKVGGQLYRWRLAVTAARIRQLQQAAGEAGDMEQVAICKQALDGDADAWRECERVIGEAG